jgi:hypothetical protein
MTRIRRAEWKIKGDPNDVLDLLNRLVLVVKTEDCKQKAQSRYLIGLPESLERQIERAASMLGS